MSGSFHFLFFVFWPKKWQKTQKSQLSCLFIFSIKKIHILPENDSWFFLFFGHFDQKTKNEKWNEPDNRNESFSSVISFHFLPYRQYAGMQINNIYTHRKKTNSRVDFRFLRMNCCKMPSLLSGTSHRAAAFQFVALCFSHDFLTVKQNQKMRYSRDCIVEVLMGHRNHTKYRKIKLKYVYMLANWMTWAECKFF